MSPEGGREGGRGGAGRWYRACFLPSFWAWDVQAPILGLHCMSTPFSLYRRGSCGLSGAEGCRSPDHVGTVVVTWDLLG